MACFSIMLKAVPIADLTFQPLVCATWPCSEASLQLASVFVCSSDHLPPGENTDGASFLLLHVSASGTTLPLPSHTAAVCTAHQRLRGSALRQLLGDGALALLELVLGLRAQDVAAPLDAGAIVEVGLESVHQLGKLTLVLLQTQT